MELPSTTPNTPSVKEFLEVIDSAVVYFYLMYYGVPKKIFFPAFDRFPDGPRPGNSCWTWSSTISSIFRRPDVDRKSTSGGATVAILDFGGPVTPEPLESERSHRTETCTWGAPVWRSNLPVVTTSGSDLIEVKVLPPKISLQATGCTCGDMGLKIT